MAGHDEADLAGRKTLSRNISRFPRWYVSGDTAYMDDDGYFYYQGRDDDLIKVAGVVIGPTEIEEVLLRHPAVEDAGIIGKTEPMKGNVIKAFISLKPGYTPSEDLKNEIRDFVKRYFSPRIVPEGSRFSAPDPEIGRWQGDPADFKGVGVGAACVNDD